MKIVDSDFKFLISKINTLEAMLNGLYAINSELRSQLTAQFNVKPPIDVRSGVIDNSGQTTTTIDDSVGMGKPTVSHSSAQRQQPQGNVPRQSSSANASIPSSAGASSNGNTDTNIDQSDDWTVVASRSKKRRIQSGGQSARARITETTDTTGTDTNSGETKQKQKQKKNKPSSKSKRVVVGTKQSDWPVVGTVDQSTVTAAKSYLRKSVFCVDNVRTDVTVSDMEKFVVDSLNVNVISLVSK